MNLFNIIKNKQEYWLVDQINLAIPEQTYYNQLLDILRAWKEQKIGYLSLLMNESFEEQLVYNGFSKVTTVVEYTRRLSELSNKNDQHIISHALADGLMSDEEYSNLYRDCKTGSANKNNSQSMTQVMSSLKSELGLDWRSHCYYFMSNGSPVGISIPHIEMGTENEGRLFYFGIVPAKRGQGLGGRIHHYSLRLLKHQFHADTYVGSTDIDNKPMIQIFEGNGCDLRAKKGMYNMSSNKY